MSEDTQARQRDENAQLAAQTLLSRAQLLLVITSTGWIAYGLQYLVVGRWPGFVHVGVGLVVVALRLALSPRTSPRGIELAVHATAGISSAGLIVLSLLTGQERSPANWFFAAVPILAIYALSVRAMIGWLGGALVGLAVVHASPLIVRVQPSSPLPDVELLVAQAALAALFLAATVAARLTSDRHIRRLEERERVVARQGHELAQQSRELVRARDAALAAARAKSDFLATMSHEIRTPLNAVIGMATLLSDADLPPDRRAQLDAIRTSGEALLTLIGDILDFSKIDAGKLDVEEAPVDLATCVEEALDQIASSGLAKGLELGYELAPGCPAVVLSDGARLRQILTNLLSNAIKFTPAGSVTVRVAAEEDGARTRLVVTVRDTGIGIADDARGRLFAPFSQVDASTTRKYGGTGLGLAICKKLCELLGGDIGVESVVGEGSTFRFTIMTSVVTAEPPTVGAAHRGAGVLVVVDQSVSRGLLAGHLARMGLAPTEARSRDAAIAALDGAPAGGLRLAVVDLRGGEVESRAAAAALVQRMGGSVRVIADGAATARPYKAAALFDAVQTALDAESVHLVTPAPYRASLPSRPDAAAISVLVVDDNELNRMVAVQMVRRLGYQVQAVESGEAAISAVLATRFDVVLMDVQMPDLDGFEATRRIRAGLGAKRGPRIVAMTANALPGDRERCLAAGMNDYVSKPVRLEALARALDGTPADDTGLSEAGSIAEILDPAVLEDLRMLEESSSTSLLEDLATTFRTDTPSRVAALRAAIAAKDGATVKATAHRMRGSAGTIGANRLFVVASQLEASADRGTLDGAGPLVDRLDSEARIAIDALERVIRRARAITR